MRSTPELIAEKRGGGELSPAEIQRLIAEHREREARVHQRTLFEQRTRLVEADNGLKNTRGTVAMARTSDPHSATAQFFVNVKDNSFLDHSGKNASGWGYAVFGKVTNGMDIVDKIVNVTTGARGPFAKDAPMENIVIKSAKKKE